MRLPGRLPPPVEKVGLIRFFLWWLARKRNRWRLSTITGVYLPEIQLWLDPHDAKPDGVSFVRHAHGDHAKWHDLTYCSEPTSWRIAYP